MTRPVRIEFEGALYHITSRGDRREAIYEDEADRNQFLKILGEVIETFNWVCHAYCQMTNHYHLVIETMEGNLSKGMRQLNGSIRKERIVDMVVSDTFFRDATRQYWWTGILTSSH